MDSAAVLAALGVGAALLGIYLQRKSVQRQATLDYIRQHEVHNPAWVELTATVNATLSDEDKWRPLITEKKNLTPPDRVLLSKIFTYLNHHELLAVCIANGIFSESVYFEWGRTAYIRQWQTAKPFIVEWRQSTNRATVMTAFESLAEEWSNTVRQGPVA